MASKEAQGWKTAWYFKEQGDHLKNTVRKGVQGAREGSGGARVWGTLKTSVENLAFTEQEKKPLESLNKAAAQSHFQRITLAAALRTD